MNIPKLLMGLILYAHFISNCSESAQQSSPTTTTSWWDRSKSYAASWVPSSIQYQAKNLSRSLNDNLNIFRSSFLARQKKLIAQDLWQLIENKLKDPNFDINSEINNIIKNVSERALEKDFDLKKMMFDATNQVYTRIILRKENLEDYISSKYKLCKTTSCKAHNEKLLEFRKKKTMSDIQPHFKIYLEMAKIIRATDFTKISQNQ